MSSETVVLTTDAAGIATLTLNRPEKHNAFNDQMIVALLDRLAEIAANPSIRVLVLAAQGQSFSAGADLAWMQRMADLDYAANLADAGRLAALLQQLNGLPVPVVGRVNGPAFGGAVGLIACCDAVFAVDSARFSLSEVKLGLVPATISPYVIRALGERAARRYFLSGERFDARRAQALGLVSEVVAADHLDTAVAQYTASMLDNGPQAVRAAKQLIAEVAGKPIDQQIIAMTSELIARVRVSEEGQAGLRAFLEKRRPPWRTD